MARKRAFVVYLAAVDTLAKERRRRNENECVVNENVLIVINDY